MQGDELVKRFKGALYPVLPQSHRLRSVALNIPWNSRETLRDILVGFSSSAPMLETLELVCDEFDGDGFPPGFLINGAPRLKELDLSRCGMRWTDIPIRSALTSLSLFEAETPHATSLRRPSVYAFLDTLKQLGRLQSLAMYGFLPAMEMREMPNEHLHPRVSLPSLSSLVLVDFHSSISYFFQTTHLPIASSIDLDFADEIPAAAILRDIFTEIPAAWVTGEKGRSPMQQDIGELKVWGFEEQSHNRGQTVSLHFQDPSNISVCLELSFYHRTLATQDIIIEIKRYSNFTSSLSSLDLTSVGSFDEAFWIATFGNCSELNKISLGCCESIHTFIDAVTNDLTSMTPDAHGSLGATTGATPSTLLFPSLDTIKLTRVGAGDWLKLDQPVNALTRLGEMLKSRSTSTRPIRVLHFDSSDAVSREDMRKLRDQVGPGVKMFSDGLSI